MPIDSASHYLPPSPREAGCKDQESGPSLRNHSKLYLSLCGSREPLCSKVAYDALLMGNCSLMDRVTMEMPEKLIASCERLTQDVLLSAHRQVRGGPYTIPHRCLLGGHAAPEATF